MDKAAKLERLCLEKAKQTKLSNEEIGSFYLSWAQTAASIGKSEIARKYFRDAASLLAQTNTDTAREKHSNIQKVALSA